VKKWSLMPFDFMELKTILNDLGQKQGMDRKKWLELRLFGN